MFNSNVTVARATYIHQRAREFIVKDSIRRAAKRRAEFGSFAVIPTEFVGLNVIANGLYESYQLSVIQKLIEAQGIANTLALDIGANIGNHTVVFSKWFRDVIAFEPNPLVATLLEANIALTGCRNVQVQRVGLGVADASLPFTPDTDGNDGKGSFAVTGQTTIPLPVLNGDKLLASLDPDLASGKRQIGFIKCDVEGFEPSVFTGLMGTLSRHAPLVMFENDNDNPSAATDAYFVLKQAGYRQLYAIRETGDDARGKIQRELKRLLSAYQFWLEPVEDIPQFFCNLVAAKTPIGT